MNFISENEQPDVLQFMQLAGFGNPEQRDDSILEATLDSFDRALFDSLQDPDQKIPASQLTVDEGFIESYSVKQRYALFSYLFEYEQLDDLPVPDKNGTADSTASAISKFDLWFSRLKPAFFQTKKTLKLVYDIMLDMDSSLPPFMRVCNLHENDRGVVLAHFTHEAKEVHGNNLKANSKGLLNTAFQRAFRKFDSKYGIHTLSTMTSWKKNPHFVHCVKQCEQQLKKDASVPLALQDPKKRPAVPMDLHTYKLVREFMVAKQASTFGVNLKEYAW